MLKFDTHVHTSETSSCGQLTAAQTVDLYKEAGYNGICITDHYTKEFFEPLDNMTWVEKINRYLKGYQNACNRGKIVNLNVILGMEIRFEYNCNDYLIYGVTERFLLENEQLYLYSGEDFRKITKQNGLLIYQAHPFRMWMTPQLPSLIDGIEVYNANPRHESRNELAKNYALEHNLKMLSGSDCHQTEDVGRGGILIKEPITISTEFVNTLQSQTVELIC